MKKYEYRIFKTKVNTDELESKLIEFFNTHGAEGWRMLERTIVHSGEGQTIVEILCEKEVIMKAV